MFPNSSNELWGITVQTSYVEGWCHQNLVYMSPKLFLQTDKEISEKENFFVKHSVTEIFQREHFSGRGLSEPPGTQLSYEWVAKTFFDCVLFAPSQLRATKCDPLAKLRGVQKTYLPQF